MATQNSPEPSAQDPRPADQQARAAAAQPNPHDPAADARRPNYGDFGGASDAPATASSGAPAAVGRDGSNDNPDEFSELGSREQNADQAPSAPADQPGHVEQNQDPAAVRAAQHADSDEQRAAWAKDDPRYAGGGTHNTREESSSTKDGQE